MNETDYNARLYEKMKAEQDKYRDWLLHQEPSEILNHTYEYTMREDIVLCMEELELEPEKARALLRSPCPLSDAVSYTHLSVCDRNADLQFNGRALHPSAVLAVQHPCSEQLAALRCQMCIRDRFCVIRLRPAIPPICHCSIPLLDCPQSVSYTHLDVYKRQPLS